VLDQFSHWLCLLFLSISFSLLLQKPYLFPTYHHTYLRKTMISNSFTIGSSWTLSTRFETHFWTFSPLEITKSYRSWEKNPFYWNFFFLTETQNCLSKTTIPDSLTVELSWKFDMWFTILFRKPSPYEIIFVERELNLTKAVQNGGFNPFSFSLTFGNPNRAIGGGALESTRNAIIDNGEHLSDYIDVRDELFTIGD